ncbi:WecB/TagA/CpsF family glycosyltransferase [Shewanella baltica]|uniref:WecB/TagA/CpsF family glycosyltransferase n=1 Tax=Shewanella baltica TaxID=62322 RepID=UPI003D7979BA
MKNKKIDLKICSINNFKNLLSDERTFCSPKLVSFVNPYSYFLLCERPELLDVIDELYVDGALLVKLHNFFNKFNVVERVSFDFSSIANDVFIFANKNIKSVALVGGSQQENFLAIQYLSEKYPKINFSLSRDGFFYGDEMNQFIDELATSGVDIVIAGMGTPLQEEFLVKLKSVSNNKPLLLFTCGGFISQTAIRGDYYFPIVKKLGLRWLQRFVLHKHVRQRVLNDYPKFIIRYLACKFN